MFYVLIENASKNFLQKSTKLVSESCYRAKVSTHFLLHFQFFIADLVVNVSNLSLILSRPFMWYSVFN